MPWSRLSILLAALWWGGISALSFLAVPILFASLGSSVAGPVAARLFALQCWAGLGLGLALLLLLRRERGGQVQVLADTAAGTTTPDMQAMQRTLGTMGCVLLGMLLAMLQEFGVAQRIVSARASGGNLPLWHGLGTVMVLGQWLCAGAALWRLSSPAKR